ncbi:MAG TPA: nuclear transport factor 2 family protein [Terriglobales bacterium]|nr:nuclear transport factor 2 family protein [Terriglobales bacterium]
MKYVALAAAVFVLSLTCPAASPQASDESGIRSTVTDYIEGYYTADAARFERSLHPHYLKHTISQSNGQLRMTETTGLQILQEVRSTGVTRPADRKEEITVLDVNGDIASAKLVTAHWVDYITLSKWEGQWKIVSVVLRENE